VGHPRVGVGGVNKETKFISSVDLCGKRFIREQWSVARKTGGQYAGEFTALHGFATGISPFAVMARRQQSSREGKED